MLNRFLIVLFYVGAFALAVPGRCVADNEALVGRVEQLVRQLDDEDLVERRAAEEALIALGPDIVSLLPGVTSPMTPEVKVRIERIRRQLETVTAKSTTEASHVTFQGTMRLTEALARLKSQTGNQLIDLRGQFGQRETDPEVTVDFDQTPFWDALATIMDQAELAIYSYSGRQRTLAFKAREEGVRDSARHVTTDGVFRIEATRIEIARDLRQPGQEGMRIRLEITWEPRVVPISVTLPLDDVQAIDDRDESLGGDEQRIVLEVAVQSTVSSVEIDLPFPLPSRQAQSITILSGKGFMLVPGQVEKFTFDKLETTKNAVQHRAGVAITLQKVRKNVDVHEALILVRFEKATGALESHRGWIYTNEAYLIDPKGNRVDHAGFETTRQDRNEIGLSYKFAVDGDLTGYQFVYETPAAILRLPWKFKLKDIALP